MWVRRGRETTSGRGRRKWIYIQRWTQHDMGTGMDGGLSIRRLRALVPTCGRATLPCSNRWDGSGTVPLPRTGGASHLLGLEMRRGAGPGRRREHTPPLSPPYPWSHAKMGAIHGWTGAATFYSLLHFTNRLILLWTIQKQGIRARVGGPRGGGGSNMERRPL